MGIARTALNNGLFGASNTEMVKWGLITYAFLKIAQRLDDMMQTAGLKITRTTGLDPISEASGVLRSIGNVFGGVASVAGHVAGVGKNMWDAGKNIGKANGVEPIKSFADFMNGGETSAQDGGYVNNASMADKMKADAVLGKETMYDRADKMASGALNADSYNTDAYKQVLEDMKNTTLASNDDERMIVVCKSFDDAGDDVACVKAQEIRDWKEKHEKDYEPISDEALTFMSTDEIYNAITADRLPERYAFEFSPWEEILSWNLAEPSVTRYGLEHCLAGILWEMTFFGVDPAGVEKERVKLDAAIEEAKQASAEGRVSGKAFSFEDFAKEVLGDEYTEDWYPEEEQERDRRNMAISSYKYGVEFRLLLESIL